ncbi:Hypothetical protein, putative [Bodo saltans]|uniref:Uncharacterized protein n=1 Tax=Bodo saltans TaxID=75058 RepID=A0A0S4JP40_BODSA|nr:Hypothetical protein, putative [Bodo saltans]|eukprot:CUG93292.1 Hypothetical protein, putative [Bodo saltans]
MEFNAVPTFTSGHHHASSSSSQVRGGAVAAQRKKKPQLSTPVSTRHPRVGGHNTPTMSTHTTAAASSAARRKSQSELERSQLEPPTASDHPRQPVAATVASTTSPLFHTPNGGGTVARPTQNSAGGGSAGGAANSDDENFEPCLSVQRPRFAELFEGGGGGSRKPSGSIASPLRSAGRSLPPLAPAAVAAPPSPFVMSKKPPLHNNHNNTSSPNVSRSLINESDYSEGGGEEAAESCKEDIERLLNDSEDVTPQLEEDAPRPHPQQHLSPGRSQPLPPRPATSDPPMPTPQQRSALPPDARGSSLEFEGGDQHFISDQEEERRSSKRLFLVADPEDFLMDPSAPTSDNERESNVQDVATPLSPTFDARAATVSMVHQEGEVVVAPKSQAPQTNSSQTATNIARRQAPGRRDNNDASTASQGAFLRHLPEPAAYDEPQTNSSHQTATNIARRQAPGRRDIDASSASQGAFLRHLPEPAAYDDAQAVVSFFEGVALSEPSLPLTSVSKPQRPVRRGNASESSVSAPPPPSSALPMVGEQSQEELLVAAATQRQQRASAERTTSFEESAASSLSTRSGGRVPSTSPPPPAPLLVEGSSPSNATQSPKSRRAPLATHLAGDTSPSPKKFSPRGGGAPLSADIVAPSLIVIGSPSASTTSNPFAGLDLSFKSNATNRRESAQHVERPTRNVVDEPPRSTDPSVVAVVDDDGDQSANEQQRGVSVASSSSSSSQHVATSTDDLIDTVISNPTPIVAAALDDNPPSSVGASSDKGGSSAPRTPTRTSRQKAHDAIKTSHRVPPQEPYLVRESIMNLVNASLSASPVTSLRAEGTAIAIDSAATHTADVESPPNISTSVRTTMPEETLPASAAASASSSMVLSPPRLQRSDTSPSASVNSPRRQDEVTGTAITTTTPTAGTTTTTTTAAVALAPQPVHRGGMLDSTSISSSVVAAASETRAAQPQLATFDVFAPTDTTEASTLLNLSASPPPPTLRLGSNARRSVSGGNSSASAIPSSSAIAAVAPVVDPTASMMAADASASGISMFSQQAAQEFHSSSVVVAHDDVMSLEEPAHSPLISLAPTNSAISPPQQQLGLPPVPRSASSAASLDRSLTNDNMMGVSSHLLHSNVQPLLSSNNNPSAMKSVKNQHESSDAASSVRAPPAAAVVGSSVTSEQEGANESFDGLRASMRSDDAESPFMITTTATAEPSPKSPLAATSSSFHAAVGSPRVASRSPKNDAVQRALKECFDTLIEQKTDAPPRNLNISTAIEGSPLRRSDSLRTGKQLLQTSPRVSDSQQSSPKKKLLLSHVAGGVEGGVDAADFMNDGGTPLKRHGSSTTTAMVPSSPWKPPTSPAPPNLRHSFQFSEPPMFAEGSSPTAALNARQLSSARIDGRVPSFSPENKSPVQIEEATEVLHHQAASSNNRLGEPVRRLPSAEFLPSVLYQHDDGNLLRRSTSQDSGGVSVADREALEEHLRALDIADSAAAARPASNLVSAQGDSIDFSFPFRRDELQLQQLALHQQYQRQNHKNAGNHGENEVDYDDGDYEDDDDDDEPRMADVTINISLAPALYKKPSSSSNDSPSRQRHSSVSVAALNDVFSFAANAPSAGNREDIAGTSLLPSAQPIVRVQRGAAQPTATHMLLEGASGQHWTAAASRHHIDDDGSLLSQRSPLPKMRAVGNSHPNNSAATPPTSAIILPNDEEDVDGTSRALVLAPIASSLSVAGGSSAAVVVVGSNISSGVDTAATLLPPPVFPNIYQDIAVVDPRAVSEEWREGLRHEPIKNPSWIQGWGGAENFLEEVVEGNRPSVDEEVDVHVLSGNRKKLTTLPTIVVGKQKPFGFTQPPPQMTTDDDDEQVSRKEIAARPPHHHASLDGIDSGDDATHPVEWMTPPPSSRRLQRKDFTPLKHVPAAAAAASCIPSEPLAVSRRSVNNVAHLSEKEQQDETQRRLRILRAIGSGSGGVSVGAADDVKLKHHYVSPLDDTLAPLSDGEGSVAVAAAAAHPVPPPSSLGSSAASLFGGERQDSEGSPNIRIPNNISTASVHHDNDSAAALSRNATVAGGSKHVLFAPSTATVDQNTSVASSNFSTSGPRFLLEHLIATQQQRQKTRLAALVSPATHDNDDDDEAIGSTSPNADKNGHSSNAAHLVSTPTTVSIQHAATTTTPTFEALAARRHEMRLKSIHSALSSIQRDRAEADERHLRRGSPHGRDVMTVVEARRQSYTTTTVTTTTAATAAVVVPPAWSPRPVPAAAPADSALFARDMRNVILGLKSTAAGLAAPSLPPPLTDGGEHHRSAVLLTPHSFVVTSDE